MRKESKEQAGTNGTVIDVCRNKALIRHAGERCRYLLMSMLAIHQA